MNYKYQPGDLVRIDNPKIKAYGVIVEVLSYNPTHNNPNKTLKLSLGFASFSFKDISYKLPLPPIECSVNDVTPLDPNQPLETRQLVFCERNSAKSKVAKILGDYVKTPLFQRQEAVYFQESGALLKGVIIAPQIDSNGILYKVRLNGHRKVKLISEANLKPVAEKLKELL